MRDLNLALRDFDLFKSLFQSPFDTEETLQRRYKLLKELSYEIRSPLALRAFAKVPRHLFVPENLRELAYLNRPLPIGFRQTISQPLMIGIMIEELLRALGFKEAKDKYDIPEDYRVLEIGTGSGYQTALLCEIFHQVYSVEIIPELFNRAREILKTLGYENLHLKLGDGAEGFPEGAPFMGIVVSAAIPEREIPTPLIEQLHPRGAMVTPLEDDLGWQYLALLRRSANDELLIERKGGVSFVKFLSKEEAKRIRRGSK